MNPYGYEGKDIEASVNLEETGRGWRRYAVSFPTARHTRFLNGGEVMGDYYRPGGASGSFPLVILVHGMADLSTLPCHLLARALAREGIAGFVLYLVLHSRRMPDNVRGRLHHLSPDEWFEGYQLAVTDIRQVIDWAGGRRELDAGRVAALGISFGGFAASIAMAIDARIRAGVFIVTGGNAEKMARLGRAYAHHDKRERSEAEYQAIQRAYLAYRAEVAESGFESIEPPRPSFLNDPLTFAPRLRGRPVLMLNATRDKYIPQESVLELWQACGQPRLRWFPAGHAGIWLFYPAIKREMLRFLKSSLTP